VICGESSSDAVVRMSIMPNFSDDATPEVGSSMSRELGLQGQRKSNIDSRRKR
jgi:hypothetical protein